MKKVLVFSIAAGLIAALSHGAEAGAMLVASSDSNKILKYDSSTGAFLGEFADTTAQGAHPELMRLSPDNSTLYVILGQLKIARYNATTGAYLDTFIPSISFSRGITFDSAGNFYAASYGAPAGEYAVKKYDTVTGAGTGYAMHQPDPPTWDNSCIGIAFGPDAGGNTTFYAYNDLSGPNRIIKYAADGSGDRGSTGLGNLITLLPNMNQADLIYAPQRGNFYATASFGAYVVEITPAGARTDVITPTLVPGFAGATSLAEGPDGSIYVPANGSKVYKWSGGGASVFIDDPVNLNGAWGIVFLGAQAELTATPAGGSTLDFGDVAQGGSATLYSVVSLRNTGDAGSTVDLQGAVLSGPGAAAFSIVLGDPTRGLAAGGPPELFDLRFNATGLPPGLYLADITFQNDSPQGDVTYHLRANVPPISEPAALGLIGAAMLVLRRRRS